MMQQMVQARKHPSTKHQASWGHRAQGVTHVTSKKLHAPSSSAAPGNLAAKPAGEGPQGSAQQKYLENLFQRSNPAAVRRLMEKVTASPRTPAHMKRMLVEQLALSPAHPSPAGTPRLLKLPPELLMQVVCHLDHDDLNGLVQSCQTLAATAKQAREQHFNFRTPLPSRVADFDFNEASTPSSDTRYGAGHVRLPSGRNAEPPAAPKIDRNPVAAVEAGQRVGRLAGARDDGWPAS